MALHWTGLRVVPGTVVLPSPPEATNGEMLPLAEFSPQLAARLPGAAVANVAGALAAPSRAKPGLRLTLATEMVPVPAVQLPFTQSWSPVGSTRNPNELPMPWGTSRL